MGAWISLALLVVAGLILVLSHDAGTIAGVEAGDFAAIVASVALLIFIGAPMLSRYRGQGSSIVKDFTTWTLLTLLLVAGYSYRAEVFAVVDRVAGELLPAGTELAVPGLVPGERAVRLRKRIDGHFVARTQVNGRAVTMLVDTGASTIVLRPADAQRAGIDLAGLSYSVPVQTANGTTFAARVRLDSVTIGNLGLPAVEALVSKPGALSQSLLGMSFLSRLRSYEFSGDYLTLRS